MDSFKEHLLGTIGELNGICKEKELFWGIKKYSWEDHYQTEVSSHNFDKRPSLHEKPTFIDDALDQMLEFAKASDGHYRKKT